jgi:chromate reductase
MTDTVRILGIAGSLRAASFNRMALKAAGELLPPGATFETAEIGELPLFNQDIENDPPEPVTRFKAAIARAEAVLFVSAEYNYSIPGVLKNAIDWGTRPPGTNAWAGRTAAIMGASPGMLGTARMQYHLRQVLINLGMQAVIQPEVMIAQAGQKFADGRLTDEKSREMIGKLLGALADLTRRLRT